MDTPSINQRLRQYFDGRIVRKDLTKTIKEGANVPVYVLEFLLGQYCSSDDEEVIEAGVQNVKRILAENYVRPDEAQKILSQLRRIGSYTVIDMVTVSLDIQKNCYFASFSNLGLPKVPIEDASKLSAVVINTTCECAADTTWFGGGGGICFSELTDADGTKFWGYKDFQYASGTGNVTVKMDGKFMKPAEKDGEENTEVAATIGDKQLVVQDWWKATAEDETGADVSVTYNTITLVYEGSANPSEAPTDTPVKQAAYGDVNEDNGVDILDVIALNRYLLGSTTLSEQGKVNADVDNSGTPDSTDSLNILKAVVEIIDVKDFPIKG